MSLEKIYVVRHGFRASWSVDHRTGTYSSSIPSPTGIPVDPALTAHGIDQARELALHLARLEPPVDAIYSSPYYRCLQTIAPFAALTTEARQRARTQSEPDTSPTPPPPPPSSPSAVRPEYGLCEWFGAAPFAHPGPAAPAVLRAAFPAWDASYATLARPPPRGETMAQLRRRVQRTAAGIVARCDAEGARAAVLCTHAAVVIMLGRVLTGARGTRSPSTSFSPGTASPSAAEASSRDDVDFDAFTCGLSIFRRTRAPAAAAADSPASPAASSSGEGRLGTWECEANSDCSFLSHGAERGWKFSGDEDFPDTGSLDSSAYKL